MKAALSAITPIKALLRTLVDECSGAIPVKLAIAVPLLTGLVIGAVQGGLLLFDEIELVNAAAIGSRTFALARHTPQPYTDTIEAVVNSGRLPLGASNVTLSVGGMSCASDADCLRALNTAYYASGAHYSSASWTTVTLTQACPAFVPASWLALAGVCSGANNVLPGFLTAQISQEVQ
jgi:Flp pilus assembly protein TadG